MSSSELRIVVASESSSGGLLSTLLLVVMVLAIGAVVYGGGYIKKTQPWYIKEIIAGTIECNEFASFFPSHQNMIDRERENKDDLIWKAYEQNIKVLEKMYNRDKDEGSKRTFVRQFTLLFDIFLTVPLSEVGGDEPVDYILERLQCNVKGDE